MNAHFEELDGCDHGRTGKVCRPDPQPLHGKDCQTHGNHGGINEGHCLAEPSTTTTTTTTTPTTSTTTTTTATPPTTTTSTSPGTPSPESGPTTTTELPVSPTSPEAPATALTVSPSRPIELAHTGAETPILVGLGLALVVVGAALKRRFRD